MRLTKPTAALLALVTLAWSAPATLAQPAEGEEALNLAPDSAVDTAVLERLFKEGNALGQQARWLDAALRYNDIISNGDPATPIVQQAAFELGGALYELGLYQSALNRFELIVDEGLAHPRYKDVLPYLLNIARKAGAEANVLYMLSQYPPEYYAAEDADELHFLVGQYYFNEDSLTDALARFQQVTERGGDFYVRARYLEGVIHTVDSKLATDPQNADGERLKAAADNFKIILRYQRDRGSSAAIDKVAAMTHLALGRLFFSTRQYRTSVRYYDQIEDSSPDWLPAIFEVSWVYFQLKNYPRALGNLHTLNSPFFTEQYFPESRVLQALILFYNCQYDEALKVVGDFVNDYYPLMTELRSQVNQFANPNAFYFWLAKLAAGGDADQQFSERFQRIFNAALADRKLRRKFFFVASLNRETKRMDGLIEDNPEAKGLLEGLKGDLTAYRSLVIGEAGGLAQARLGRVLKELKSFLAGALRIKGETLKAQRGRLSDKVLGEQRDAAAAKNPIVIDDEHFEWDWTGEFWKDELGSYIYDIQSTCTFD